MERKWWRAPLLLTLAALGGFVLFLPVLGISAMAFDPYEPGGCPQARQRLTLATAVWGLSFLTVPAAWLLPRHTGFDTARRLLIPTYVLLFVAAVLIALTVPVGE